MKKFFLLALVSLMSLTATVPAIALGPVDVDAELALNSKYVWRGMVFSPDPVIQTGASASIMGIGFGFWGNIDTSDINGTEWVFNEIDWTASYGIPLPIVDLEFGLINYTFPHSGASSTREFYAAASAGILFSPALAYYYDFGEVNATYIEASISHDVALNPSLNLELGLGLGFGSDGWTQVNFNGAPASMTDFHLSAGLPFDSIPFFTITPHVTYNTLMGDAKDGYNLSEGDEGYDPEATVLDTDALYFGITASFSF